MSYTFVNPYNFIPLANKKDLKREPVKNSGELLSGKIKYTIRTATPLFIPNTSNDQYFDIKADHQTEEEYHKSYDFFSYTDLRGHSASEGVEYTPVIPGSEMRGAVRSLYETFTDSCFSAMDSDAILSRRTPQRYEPGILSYEKKGNTGEWKLYKADDYICRDNTDFSKRNSIGMKTPDGSKVKFSCIDRDRGKPIADLKGTRQEGYIIKGNDGPVLPKGKNSKCDHCPSATKIKCEAEDHKKCYTQMKHNYHVFKETKIIEKNVKKETIIQFSNVLDLYEQNVGSSYKEYIARWKIVKKDGGKIPVYYNLIKKDNNTSIIYLSPACITREVYQNTFKDVIGSRYSTCSEKGCLCPACQLFGIVNTESGIQKASSIRFSDLTVISKDKYYGEPVTLAELGTPKPSSMEFYLKKPDGPDVKLNKGDQLLVWTYDYYIVVDANGNTRVVVYDPEIAGRKMYWHSKKAADFQLGMNEAKKRESEKKDKTKDIYITKRNKTIRPVNRDVSFEGYVYFDKISSEELNRLIALLDMSNAKGLGKQYDMKLGAAKPLGFGSVETRVDSVSLRKLTIQDDVIGFAEEEHYDLRPLMTEPGLFDAATEDNLELLNFDAIDETKYTVHYPYVEGNTVLGENEDNASSKKKEDKPFNEEEEGFKWFVNNRSAFGYKSVPNPNRPGKMKDDRTRIDIMKTSANPGEGKQVPYREYMQAPKPVLVINFIPNKINEKRAPQKHDNRRESYELNKVYTATFTGKRRGNFADLKLPDGGSASVYDGDHQLNEGDTIKVIYKGKRIDRNGKERDNWRRV